MINILIFLCCFTFVSVQVTLKDLDLQALQPGDTVNIYGSSSDHYFGRSVSNAGDVNGDGIDDIIIGAAQTAAMGTGPVSGISYVIFGNKDGISDLDIANLTPSQGFKILGPNNGDSTGWAVSKAGDVNGDGIGDLLIGAPHTPLNGRGAVYVFLGQKTLSRL